MKKVFIGFVLLLNFLAFGILDVNANLPYPPSADIMRKKAEEIYNTGCLQEYKSKLPQKYLGPNLSFIDHNPHYRAGFPTENEYFIDSSTPWRPLFSRRKSIFFDCDKESIDFTTFHTTPSKSQGDHRVNVKDVPSGSFLKLTPNEREMRVIVPTDKEYDTLMESYNKYMEELPKKIREEEIREEEKNKEINCFYEHKSNLTKNYKGPNLKLEEQPTYTHFTSGKEYFVESCYSDDIVKTYSTPISCKQEFVNLGCEKYPKNRYINVIDVPPGSYLKYLSEKEEVQIISSTEKAFKEAMKNYNKEGKKSKQKKFREKIKNIISTIIFCMGITVLFIIFTKKFTKKN